MGRRASTMDVDGHCRKPNRRCFVTLINSRPASAHLPTPNSTSHSISSTVVRFLPFTKKCVMFGLNLWCGGDCGGGWVHRLSTIDREREIRRAHRSLRIGGLRCFIGHMAAGPAAEDLPRLLRRCGFTDIKMGTSALVLIDAQSCVFWEATAL